MVTLTGSPLTDVTVWLPPSIVTLSVITVVINDGRKRCFACDADPNSHRDYDSLSRGYNEEQQHGRHQPTVFRRFLNEPVPGYIFRAPNFSQSTPTERSGGSTLTLSSTPAQARPSWGWRVLEFFVDLKAVLARQQPPRRSGQSSPEDTHDRAATVALLDGNMNNQPDLKLE